MTVTHHVKVAGSRKLKSWLRLLQAARGQYIPKEAIDNCNTKKVQQKVYSQLPCFPLHPHHVRSIPPANALQKSAPSPESTSDDHRQRQRQQCKKSAMPQDFHAHLCTSILNAKHRIKFATLYIGAGNGCMSIPPEEDSHKFNPKKEEELLANLRKISSYGDKHDKNNMEIKILMDMSRALRPIRVVHSSDGSVRTSNIKATSSAQEVYSSLFPKGKYNQNPNGQQIIERCHEENSKHKTKAKGVYLFNVHDGLKSMIPSPLNEALGVFHLKIYIIDDELILSGANLSEEYFTDRLDRYISFVGGANGLVDFYSDLIDILSDYAIEYNPDDSAKQKLNSGTNSNMTQVELLNALSKLFNQKNEFLDNLNIENSSNHDDLNEIDQQAFAYAVPTFQLPPHFLSKQQQSASSFFPQDVSVTRNLLFAALENYPSSTVHISSAYLNPTPFFMSALAKFGTQNEKNHDEEFDGAAFLLTASPTSHGFKPRKNDAVNGSGKGWVPSVFIKLAHEVRTQIISKGGKLLLYKRDGWTFHSKGIWLTSGNLGNRETFDNTQQSTANTCISNSYIHNPDTDLIATVIGSSNFGSRSEVLDFESNCILIMNPNCNNSSRKVIFADEWNSMLDHTVELGDKDYPDDDEKTIDRYLQNVLIKVARKFF
mmetsp:Transcript_122/g.113  ORF Transcript_122/g.113 Transcript_122/m.113 type:complete len:656 (-) Transcript_122:89-2056(-)